jgi:hypothetical protein
MIDTSVKKDYDFFAKISVINDLFMKVWSKGHYIHGVKGAVDRPILAT